MRNLIFLVCMFLPAFAWSQTSYEVDFSSLKNTGEFPTKEGVKLSNKNISDGSIVIKNVPKAEVDNITLSYKEDRSKIITAQQESEGGDKVKLVYKIGSMIAEAKGKLELLYKGHSNGVYQFEIEKEKDNSGDNDGDENTLTGYLAVMANANFVGNNKFLSNLTPIVNLGGILDIYGDGGGEGFSWQIDVNPYLGAQIDTKDSVSFVPAMMLSGRAGFGFNNYLSWSGENVSFTWMPLGIGLKIIPGIKDSTINLWQHNLRTGMSLRYKNAFIIGMQYTHGFHNTTSESRMFYEKVFTKTSTDIQFLTVTGQFYIKPSDEEQKSNYLYIEWRGLLNRKSYSNFTNNSIITLGFRKDILLTNTFPTAVSTRKVRNKIPTVL